MPVNALQSGVTNLNLPQLIKHIIVGKKMINSHKNIQKGKNKDSFPEIMVVIWPH